MMVLTTSTSSIEEQLQELQKQLDEKDAQIAALSAQVANQHQESKQEREKIKQGESPSGTSCITLQDIQKMITHGIKEPKASQNPPIMGYRKPYPAHYDFMPYPSGYQRPNFDKFDGVQGSPHEHLAHFYSACGETALTDALLIRQFVQSLKGSAFTWYTQLLP